MAVRLICLPNTQIRIHKLSYFTTNFWNILDVVVILISYICIVFNLYRLVKVDTMLENLLGNIDSFPDFEFLCYWQLQFNNAIALTVFLSWIKVGHWNSKRNPQTFFFQYTHSLDLNQFQDIQIYQFQQDNDTVECNTHALCQRCGRLCCHVLHCLLCLCPIGLLAIRLGACRLQYISNRTVSHSKVTFLLISFFKYSKAFSTSLSFRGSRCSAWFLAILISYRWNKHRP